MRWGVKCKEVAKYKRGGTDRIEEAEVKQEASLRATDGLQPEGSDAEEFQAESRQRREGAKREGGARGTRKGGALLVVKRTAHTRSGTC